MSRWVRPCLVAITGLLAVPLAAGEEPSSEERLAQFDQGPSSIDVSEYPPEMQESYELFAIKCSQCHTLARPINSEYALAEEWSRYVKRMMRKPGSGITPAEGKRIYEFLTYDSTIRKADLIEAKRAAGDDGH